jgi:hypothetical protein
LTTPEPDAQDKTAPIELPAEPPAPPEPELAPVNAVAMPEALSPEHAVSVPVDGTPVAQTFVPRPAQQEVMFVPLAVSVGDGFKFGCGFFLAMVLAMLVGFVVLALLFVITSVFGVNVPFGR